MLQFASADTIPNAVRSHHRQNPSALYLLNHWCEWSSQRPALGLGLLVSLRVFVYVDGTARDVELPGHQVWALGKLADVSKWGGLTYYDTEAAHENESRLAVPSCHGRR